MKIMFDTNILISNFFLDAPYVESVVNKIVQCDCEVFIDNYCLEEFGRVLGKKFFKTIGSTKKWTLAYENILDFRFKPIFSRGIELKYKTRDAKDDRILNSAILNEMDVLLTGDSDFYGCQNEKLKVMTPRQLYDVLNNTIQNDHVGIAS
ncbi:MAG: putative toxin-antitoxin system toxin component, PIN family [Mycoplasmataceae bacterium]|jgi:putative PIN family toxin of toxin-antitoxin system|nr:putative toxin-antitoxin system toxin component, PIN family [Mycoplasmataceae bacterium]